MTRIKYFDEKLWDETVRRPDWYIELQNDYDALMRRAEREDEAIAKAIKDEVRGFFEERLEANVVALAQHGPDLDVERQPIDTVVVHHSSSAPGYYSLPRLNAVHLLNIYRSYYLNPHVPGEEHLKGQPIWSNHFDAKGRQVFYAYHWIVRVDGTAQRLLHDNQIGWQAGNWDVNTRSVGICLDDDYRDKEPSEQILRVLAGIIREHYSAARILGHREVNPKTVCPGERFLSGWKERLLAMVA